MAQKIRLAVFILGIFAVCTVLGIKLFNLAPRNADSDASSFAYNITNSAQLAYCACCQPVSVEDLMKLKKARKGKISVVATIFPEYDWLRNIVGDRTNEVEITLLQQNGADLHNYEPSAADIVKIAKCDLFVYIGGESDAWVAETLRTAKNPRRLAVNLMEALGDNVKSEEVVEGMEVENDEDGGEEEEEEERDEHVWLSLRYSSFICQILANALSTVDPEGFETYNENFATYMDDFYALDCDYRTAVKEAKRKTLLFADRFPFRYLVDDYDLKYYAAFVGCSAESHASFKTVTFLAGKVDELALPVVYTLENPGHEIADSVISATSSKSAKTVTLNSMQSVTTADILRGTTYLSIMRENLDALKKGLE